MNNGLQIRAIAKDGAIRRHDATRRGLERVEVVVGDWRGESCSESVIGCRFESHGR